MLSESKINTLNKHGIVKLDNFLVSSELEKLKHILKKYSPAKGDKKSYFSQNNLLLFFKLLKLNFSRFEEEKYILNLCKNKKLQEDSQKYFNCETKLVMVDAYFSKKNNDPILGWHQDVSGNHNVHPNNFSLKFFIYLSKVGSDNGCMSYIQGSHLICDAIRWGIYERKMEFGEYRDLDNFRNFITIKKNYNFLKNYLSQKIIDNFLDKTAVCSDSAEHEMDYSANPGDAIIFNEKGLHRGSAPKLNDRMVLRYHFKEKKYADKNLSINFN